MLDSIYNNSSNISFYPIGHSLSWWMVGVDWKRGVGSASEHCFGPSIAPLLHFGVFFLSGG